MSEPTIEQQLTEAIARLQETTLWLESCVHPERRSKELQLMTFGEHRERMDAAIEQARAFLIERRERG